MNKKKVSDLVNHYTQLKDNSLQRMKQLTGKPQQGYHTACFSNFTLFVKELERMRDNMVTKDRVKLCIVSHARSGKDTLAEILRDEFGYKFESSSKAASEIFIYDVLKDKYGYTSAEECFEDRVKKRQEWFELIQEFNAKDKAALAKVIMSRSDVYVGMRDREEIESCLDQDVFDLVVWVDASKRVPDEPSTSFNISKDVAHLIIDNNSTLENFREKAIKTFKYIL